MGCEHWDKGDGFSLVASTNGRGKKQSAKIADALWMAPYCAKGSK